MSVICNTRLGLIRRRPILGGGFFYLVNMPCGAVERVSQTQFDGKHPVDHGAVCAAGCGYHETHDFSAVVAAAGGFRTQ